MRNTVFLLLLAMPVWAGTWARHVIDDSSRGADGVRLMDIDGDGLVDIATGWEEGGTVRVYRNPGPLRAKKPWPRVTVGTVDSPEDAVFADLDGDGTIDVVSSCEGEERTIFIHWAAGTGEEYMETERWETGALGVSRGMMQWMYSLPLEVDFRRGIDLVAGAKGPGAQIGWFESPANPRALAEWRWHPIREAGWVMSLISSDMDGDGDRDILFSDRRGESSGVWWVENPGSGPQQFRRWAQRPVGALGEEVMFLAEGDLDGDGLLDVVSAVRPSWIVVHRRLDRRGRSWEDLRLDLPEDAGTAKAVAVGDIDLNGSPDVVFSCEQAKGELSGVWWFSYKNSSKGTMNARNISGPQGIKYDRIELVDMDGDGDLDVLTCEETANLGVIWYENPAR